MANTTADPLSVHNPGVIIHSTDYITTFKVINLIRFMESYEKISGALRWISSVTGILPRHFWHLHHQQIKLLDLAQILMERAAAIRFSQRLIRKSLSQLVKMEGFMLCGEPDWKIVWTGKSKARKYISCIRRTKRQKKPKLQWRLQTSKWIKSKISPWLSLVQELLRLQRTLEPSQRNSNCEDQTQARSCS